MIPDRQEHPLRLLAGCETLPPMDDHEDHVRDQKPKGKSSQGRFQCLNNFVDFTLAGLTRAEMAVWFVLYRDTKDGIAAVGVDDLARRVGADRRTVLRTLGGLIKAGLVKSVRKGGINRGVSIYRVVPLAKEK
jgi:predicted transcriptional regulator